MEIKRRDFVTSVLASGVAAPALAAKGDHNHASVEGPLANATVSFGHWMQFDRFPNNNDRLQNGHQLIPRTALIRRGGTVNFIIGGFHHVLVYAPGTKPDDINATLTIPVTAPPGPPLINDPMNRVYRGLDPSLHPQDRVEVVVFPKPGRYLVICGVQPHFVDDDMYGFVRVI
jgi:hypothetical protein